MQGPVIKQRRLGEVIGRERMRPDAPVAPILDAVIQHAFEATKCAAEARRSRVAWSLHNPCKQ